jgi:hypothetical protein
MRFRNIGPAFWIALLLHGGAMQTKVVLGAVNGIYPDCQVDSPWDLFIGDGYCDSPVYNTAECGWDGGDCVVKEYPDCHVDDPHLIGDGSCDDGEYNTAECGWDGGDCVVKEYSDCHIVDPQLIGNGYCDYGEHNTAECGWDGGDCVEHNRLKQTTFDWVDDDMYWMAERRRFKTILCTLLAILSLVFIVVVVRSKGTDEDIFIASDAVKVDGPHYANKSLPKKANEDDDEGILVFKEPDEEEGKCWRFNSFC